MPSPVISLRVPNNSILNCLGIQPVFQEKGFIDSSFLGFVYRVANCKNHAGSMHNMMKFRLGKDNDQILKNIFHKNDSNKRIVDTLLNNSFTLKHNVPLDTLLQNDELLKETLLYYFERIRYYISIGKGNFIITSRLDLYNKRLFTAKQAKNLEMYLVDENILPKNMIIVGHKNNHVFANPYIAVPIIDKTHFNDLCSMNGINLNQLNDIDAKMRYPMIEKYLNLYSLYQSYLDNVEIPYWYIETFRNPTSARQKAYYTTLFFD